MVHHIEDPQEIKLQSHIPCVTYLSYLLSMCLYIYIYWISIYLSIYLSICLSICLSIYYLCVYLNIPLSLYLSIYLYLQYLYLSLSLSISIYLYLPLSMSIYLHLSINLIYIYLPNYLSVFLSIYLLPNACQSFHVCELLIVSTYCFHVGSIHFDSLHPLISAIHRVLCFSQMSSNLPNILLDAACLSLLPKPLFLRRNQLVATRNGDENDDGPSSHV